MKKRGTENWIRSLNLSGSQTSVCEMGRWNQPPSLSSDLPVPAGGEGGTVTRTPGAAITSPTCAGTGTFRSRSVILRTALRDTLKEGPGVCLRP